MKRSLPVSRDRERRWCRRLLIASDGSYCGSQKEDQRDSNAKSLPRNTREANVRITCELRPARPWQPEAMV